MHDRDLHESYPVLPFTLQRFESPVSASGGTQSCDCNGQTSFEFTAPAKLGTGFGRIFVLYLVSGWEPCTNPNDNGFHGCYGLRFNCAGNTDWVDGGTWYTDAEWSLRMKIEDNNTGSPRSATLTLTQQQTNATITVTVNQEG